MLEIYEISSTFQLFELEKSQVSIKPTRSQVYGISEVFRAPWAVIVPKNYKFTRFSPSESQKGKYW